MIFTDLLRLTTATVGGCKNTQQSTTRNRCEQLQGSLRVQKNPPGEYKDSTADSNRILLQATCTVVRDKSAEYSSKKQMYVYTPMGVQSTSPVESRPHSKYRPGPENTVHRFDYETTLTREDGQFRGLSASSNTGQHELLGRIGPKKHNA